VEFADFDRIEKGETSLDELADGLQPADLRRLTNRMLDEILMLVRDQDDAAVTFVPQDPQAYDPAAKSEEEVGMAWTLGHVIVHTTASSEEAAVLAAELARGVPERGGRSRSEVHWTTVDRVDQCIARLEESRRMRLASLEMWPNEPDLENRSQLWNGEMVNAVGRFLSGLWHEYNHLNQLEEIVAQATGKKDQASVVGRDPSAV